MTDQQHPITPPPELVQQWLTEGHHQDYCSASTHAIAQAANWGADQELEACCEWLVHNYNYPEAGNPLRSERRRHTPPSLKERIATMIAHGDISIALALLDQALPD